ncbi:hypothetical protein [Gilvimarinus algae]|uniref:DUF2232 domain-containing protein n=1 Tax=Gilvimarinus algae TaxID=3058037 RepID=A0ABT8TGR0_9GAMM|nr:hypothetical protein [Gilvimarinus sp. SDUM040014]MDO3383281.1 hypothetical protein [Gilvimarinus sp. SDUM040014]
MRALAEFIMRGRTQAAAVALIGHWIPLVSPATVALVTLRRGLADGALVLLWALLPALVLLAMGQQNAFLAVTGAVSVWASSLVLRTSSSWQHTLMGLVALNTLGALALLVFWPQLVAEFVAMCKELFEALQAQAEQPIELPEPDAAMVLGLLAAMTALSGALGLILGRWWQGLLYNPGGFATEFRALRLRPVASLVCIAAVVYCYLQPAGVSVWALVFAQPLLFAGIALVHAMVAKRGLGVQWLVLFYLALVLLQPLKILLVFVAFGDTWLDFRARVKAKSA